MTDDTKRTSKTGKVEINELPNIQMCNSLSNIQISNDQKLDVTHNTQKLDTNTCVPDRASVEALNTKTMMSGFKVKQCCCCCSRSQLKQLLWPILTVIFTLYSLVMIIFMACYGNDEIKNNNGVFVITAMTLTTISLLFFAYAFFRKHANDKDAHINILACGICSIVVGAIISMVIYYQGGYMDNNPLNGIFTVNTIIFSFIVLMSVLYCVASCVASCVVNLGDWMYNYCKNNTIV